MRCTSPLYRLPKVYAPHLGDLFIRNSDLQHRKCINGGYFFGRDEYKKFEKFGAEWFQQVGCGQCQACRRQKQLEWSIRCSKEAELYEHNYFITLTYNDFHLPVEECLNLYTGEFDVTSTLRIRDFQLFMKRLRKGVIEEFGATSSPRVFYSGEYGDLYGRPHFHAILFNMPDLFSDFILRRSCDSYRIYNSPFIDNMWSDKVTGSIGLTSISECNFNTIAYTAKYAMKRYHGSNVKDAKIAGLPVKVNPFCEMSRRPGISREWYEAHKDDIYENDKLPYWKDMQVHWSKPPRYFDKLYDLDNPDEMSMVRFDREQLRAGKFRAEDLTAEQLFIKQDEAAARLQRSIKRRKESSELDLSC